MAREHISPDVTMKGFKKCCISSAVNGIDDDYVRTQNLTRFVYLVYEIKSEIFFSEQTLIFLGGGS